MTVSYCGTCGTANSGAAKFCRHCGAEFTAQEARQLHPLMLVPSKQPALTSASAPTIDKNSTTNPLLGAITASSGSSTRSSANTVDTVTADKPTEQPQFRPISNSRLALRLAQTKRPPAPATEQQTAPGLTKPQQTSAALPKATSAQAANKKQPASQPQPANNVADIPESRKQSTLEQARNIEAAERRSALPMRIAAAVIGTALLGGGSYFYLRQNSANNQAGKAPHNIVSPDEQSAYLLNAGLADLQQGKIEDATVKLERAIALAPDKTEPQQKLAETYEFSGRANEALRTYASLLKLTPEDLETKLKVAQLQRRLGNFAEARAQYQQIIALNHASPQAGIALEAIEEIDAQTNQASQLAALNTTRLRRNAKGLRLGPVLPQAPSMASGRLALALPNPLNLPDARNNITPWSTLHPLEAPDPKAMALTHKERGTRYLNIREYNVALQELQAAVRLSPKDKDLYYLIGSAYKGLGQPLKAFDHYKLCDSGDYASTAQSAARQTEKAARKEYDQQQERLYQKAPKPEPVKQTEPTKSNLGASAGAGFVAGRPLLDSKREPEQ